MLVRRFTGYFPDPPTLAWSTVLVREAASWAGPWDDSAQIAALPYSPAGEYVTDDATLEDGWYQLVFVTTDGTRQPTEQLRAPAPWTPTVQDVADVSTGYTRAPIAEGGQRRMTFDATTDPTAGEVRGYIAAAVEEVQSRVGMSIPVRAYELAGVAAKWHAAATVEAEHGARSADSDQAFQWKRSSYTANLARLQEAVRPAGLRLS